MKPYFHFLISLIPSHLSYSVLSRLIMFRHQSYPVQFVLSVTPSPQKIKGRNFSQSEESRPSHMLGENLFLIFVVSNF